LTSIIIRAGQGHSLNTMTQRPRKVALLNAQYMVRYREVQLGGDFGDEIEGLTGVNAAMLCSCVPATTSPRHSRGTHSTQAIARKTANRTRYCFALHS
jgi:hypothetical protein